MADLEDEIEMIAHDALDAIGWRLEDRAGARLKIEDNGGVGTATSDEMIMYDALTEIVVASYRSRTQGNQNG